MSETIEEPPVAENLDAEATPIANASNEVLYEAPASTEPEFDFLASLGDKFDEAATVEEPAATEPVPATEPAATEPAATEPAATEPAATEPATEGDGLPFAKVEDLPADWTPESSTKWGELRSELKEERAKNKDLLAQNDTLESSSASRELERKLAEATEQLAEYEGEIAASRVERSQEYRTVVTTPLQNILDVTTTLAEKYGVNPEVVIDIYAGKDDPAWQSSKLAEVVGEFSEPDRMRVYRMMDDSANILNRGEEIQANAANALHELEEREAQASRVASQKNALEYRESLKGVFGLLGERLPDLGDPAKLGNLLEAVQKDTPLAQTSVNQQAYGAAAAVVLPEVLKVLRSKEAAMVTLQKQVEGLTGAKPTIDSSGVDGTGPVTVDPTADFLASVFERG